MRRAAKVDINQQQIVRELRARGYSVRHTHTIGKGFPDIVIGRGRFNMLVEIKLIGEKLTFDEQDFFDTWKGSAIIGYDADHIHTQFVKAFQLMKG